MVAFCKGKSTPLKDVQMKTIKAGAVPGVMIH